MNSPTDKTDSPALPSYAHSHHLTGRVVAR